MNNKDKNRVIDALKEKGVDFPCPRCDGFDFEIVDQTNIILQEKKIMPSAIIVCSDCGFVTFHSLGVLGLKEIYNSEQ